MQRDNLGTLGGLAGICYRGNLGGYRWGGYGTLGDGGLVILLKIGHFGVWVAPGGFKTIQKGGGLRPPPCWMVLKPPGAAQTPKMTDFLQKDHQSPIP